MRVGIVSVVLTPMSSKPGTIPYNSRNSKHLMRHTMNEDTGH